MIENLSRPTPPPSLFLSLVTSSSLSLLIHLNDINAHWSRGQGKVMNDWVCQTNRNTFLFSFFFISFPLFCFTLFMPLFFLTNILNRACVLYQIMSNGSTNLKKCLPLVSTFFFNSHFFRKRPFSPSPFLCLSPPSRSYPRLFFLNVGN